MEDLFIKVKDKVRRSTDGKPKDHPNSPESKNYEYLSNKPLPYPPEHRTGVSRPTVSQVNALGPKQSVHRDNSTPSSSPGSDKISSQHLLPELDLNGLNIDDPIDAFYDAEDKSSTAATGGQGERSSEKLSNNSQPLVDNPNDTGDVSRKINDDPTAISSTIPDRRSSKNFDAGRNDAVVGSHNLINAPNAEAAVRRKQLPPQAQIPPEFDLTNTVDTSVETTQAPAVTHEVRHKHTEEIIHRKITRDIHVDHYREYIQPIKEVIVKPAIHFTVDENGEKVRIPTPDCWEPPPGFTPTTEDKDLREAKLGDIARGVQESLSNSSQKTDPAA